MRTSGAKYVDSLVRFASVLATLFIGVAFVMVTSANAAEPNKKIEVKDKAKIEKIEKIEELEELEELEGIEGIKVEDSRGFNRGLFFDNKKLNNIRFNNNFNRGLFFERDKDR